LTLTIVKENALRIFERKITRRIYGPVMENDVRRTRYTGEINTLLKGENLLRFIKSPRLIWLGDVERIE
jgi:hypothetical protein